MKEIKFLGKGKVAVVDVEDLTPGPGEVVVRTAATVLCGSEMHPFKGEGLDGNAGHEGAGTIIKVGEGVTSVKVGDRVGMSPVAPCKDAQCPYCSTGRFTWCRNFGFYGNFHAEQVLESAGAVQILPDDVPWDVATLITGDGLGVPFHSSRKFINQDTKTVAVFGAGPIGLGNIIMQKYLGRKVIVSDFSETRLELAKRLGADEIVNPGKCDAVAAIKKWSGGQGVDVAMECSGRPEPVHNCLSVVHVGGQVIFNGEQGDVPMNISEEFIRHDITATGSWFYHFREFHDMLALYRQGFPVTSLITHRFPFEDAQKAYDLFAAGKSGKILLTY